MQIDIKIRILLRALFASAFNFLKAKAMKMPLMNKLLTKFGWQLSLFIKTARVACPKCQLCLIYSLLRHQHSFPFQYFAVSKCFSFIFFSIFFLKQTLAYND